MAFAALDEDAVVEDFGVVLSAVILFFALAIDFSFGIEVIDDKENDVPNLAVCDRIFLFLHL